MVSDDKAIKGLNGIMMMGPLYMWWQWGWAGGTDLGSCVPGVQYALSLRSLSRHRHVVKSEQNAYSLEGMEGFG